MYETEIKDAYTRAGKAVHEARALLEKKERSADDEKQIDTLLAQAEEHKATARDFEGKAARDSRVSELEKEFRTPDEAKRLPLGGPSADAGDDAGRQLKAFRQALKVGPYRLGPDDSKALIAADDTQGGYLVGPQQFVAELLKAVDNQTFMRGLANVLPTLQRAVSLGVPTLATNPNDADWTTEVAAASEDTAITFGARELKPNMLSKLIKISKRLILHSVVPAEQIVRDRLAYIYGVTMEKGYLVGTGQNQPLGVFTASTSGISTGRDYAAASATALAGDDLIGCAGALKPQYRANAQWIFNRSIVTYLMKLKDSQNRYLWMDGLGSGKADTLLGYPVNQSEYAPSTMTSGLYTGIIGDFKAGYWIVDAMSFDIQVLTELYAVNNENGYIGRLETDGMPVLEEAFSRLKQA